MKINVHIPLDFLDFNKEKELSPLVRPFYKEGQWTIDPKNLARWGLTPNFALVNSLEDSDMMIFPAPVKNYRVGKRWRWLKELCANAHKFQCRSFIFLEGDFGEVFPDLPGLYYLRLGGFNSQMSQQNLGIPFLLSDHMQRLFGTEAIAPLAWQEEPLVGFCGHASPSKVKALKEYAKFIRENGRRILRNPSNRYFEPLFASARERWKVLQHIEANKRIKTNFIYHPHYRAGAQTQADRERTTREYYQNIRESAYILCIRGGGNVSVRLYETLMMGRIPIFVNTDGRLPFEKDINWKEHVVWVEWKDREKIDEIVRNFHKRLNHQELINLQVRNRRLWLEKMNLNGIYDQIFHLKSKS